MPPSFIINQPIIIDIGNQAMTNPGWKFDNSYTRLSKKLFSIVEPEKVPSPELFLFNTRLAGSLGLDFLQHQPSQAAAVFSGNSMPPGAEPLAQAYAGHQFGYFTILGDGRAILLGEHIDQNGRRWDIQLKGSGRTPYSRNGDGKATLASMLREYLVSEAMHALGIPGSRSLAVTLTGEKVRREDLHQGAVLTRLLSSHLRIGTFEYARRFLSIEEFSAFCEYVISRHFPGISEKPMPALELLKAVMEVQASLVVEWMRVGFIHGVMNTDNTSIAGETFDYGPCAFLNVYDPETVFSSIDSHGRYAFGNQPKILHWNLGVLAGTLLVLIDLDENNAIAMAREVLDDFPGIFESKWLAMMRRKLGLNQHMPEDKFLADNLLHFMQLHKADYTNAFIMLENSLIQKQPAFREAEWQQWEEQWHARLNKEGSTNSQAVAIMKKANPRIIPRNHLTEEALSAAVAGNKQSFNEMLEAVTNPYTDNPLWDKYRQPPPDGDISYRTYCGT